MAEQSDNRTQYFTNQFLIAMPGLQDPNFKGSVIYVCEHNAQGAMGVVVNHPLAIPASRIFESMDLSAPEGLANAQLLLGGPMHRERGLILHRPTERQWDSTIHIDPEVLITASKDILVDMAADSGPEEALIVLGYAGWGPGQLEQEVAANAWLTVPGNPDIIFSTPYEERAHPALESIGIAPHQLAIQAGHA